MQLSVQRQYIQYTLEHILLKYNISISTVTLKCTSPEDIVKKYATFFVCFANCDVISKFKTRKVKCELCLSVQKLSL